MSSKLFSIPTSASTATTAPRPTLFGRVLYRLRKAFTRSTIKEKGVNTMGQKEHDVLPLPKYQLQAQSHQEVNLLVQENAPQAPPTHVAAEGHDFATPSPSLNWAGDEIPTTTPSLTSTMTVSSTRSSIRPPQVTKELEAANKRLAELEALIAQRRLEHAAYVKKVEKMDLPRAIKIATEDRDIFRGRLEPAQKEFTRKAAEHEAMGQKWHEAYELRLTKQLRMLGAKRGLEDQAKEYAELEAKFLELQSQLDSAQHEAA